LDGKLVCWLHIEPGETPAYVKTSTGKTLFIRNGNQSRALEIDQIAQYHNSRFSETALAARRAAVPAPVVPKPVAAVRKPKFHDFRHILERFGQHRSERYFILKSIIINNLFGVDIMEEAVEICKLRLFLKLVLKLKRLTRSSHSPTSTLISEPATHSSGTRHWKICVSHNLANCHIRTKTSNASRKTP
jgi:hypothetical protein